MRGAAHSRNESYNALPWAIYPKEYLCGLDIAEVVANLSLLNFNDGATAVSKALSEMDCCEGLFPAQ